ncbi:putative FAR-17a/AIG1-like protein [Seiridium unicorne]|uniref:FAR-17a/AIG1-like protein n=1 Tax=Seiridium unicorne TaxID=138068 RepID=A0ABR2UNM6_9PEZI
MFNIWFLSGVTAPFDSSNRLITSAFMPPLVLGLIRLTFAVYGVAGIFIKLIIAKDESAGASFSYFSNITYWGITFYLLFSSFHGLAYALRGVYPLAQWPKFLQALHLLLYSTIVNYPFIVTIVFWSLQYGPEKLASPYLAWSNISRHALNALVSVLEVILPRTEPMPWVHAPLLVLMLGGYCAIVYITEANEGFYTYGFMNPTKQGPGKVAGMIVGIGVGSVFLFAIIRLVIMIRCRLTEKDQARPLESRDGPETQAVELVIFRSRQEKEPKDPLRCVEDV